MHWLLATADWDPDLVRDDLRGYVVEDLGDPRCWWWTRPGSSRRASLRWGCSASTRARPARSTTASWGCSWPTPAEGGGRSSTRELYLPRSWTNDPARGGAARVPEQVGFRTKPQLARVMLERALDAEVPGRPGGCRRAGPAAGFRSFWSGWGLASERAETLWVPSRPAPRAGAHGPRPAIRRSRSPPRSHRSRRQACEGRMTGSTHPPRPLALVDGQPSMPQGLNQKLSGLYSAQRQRRQLTAPSLEPAVTSSFHPPKAAKTSPFSRSGTLK